MSTDPALPFRGSLLDRRQMLGRMASGFGMLGLAGLLGPSALASEAVRPSHSRPRAKRVIFLFMNGGPSHVDTFDPKPGLLKHQGEQPGGSLFKKSNGAGYLPSPLRFDRCGRSGIEVSETLPHIGKVALDGRSGHAQGRAQIDLHTGRAPAGFEIPGGA